MHPQLEVIRKEYLDGLAELRSLAADASEEEWTQRPPDGGGQPVNAWPT